jgi:hypothetical protein
MAFELPSRHRRTNSPLKVVGAMIVGGIVVVIVLYLMWARLTRRHRAAELIDEYREQGRVVESHEDTLRMRGSEWHAAITSGDRKEAAHALDLPLLVTAEGKWSVQPEACRSWLGKTTWITTFQELDRLVDCLVKTERSGQRSMFVSVGCRVPWGCQHRLDRVDLAPW